MGFLIVAAVDRQIVKAVRLGMCFYTYGFKSSSLRQSVSSPILWVKTFYNKANQYLYLTYGR